MNVTLLRQFLTLSLYVVWMGYSFCDGFRLPVRKKLACFVPLLIISIFVFLKTGTYSLPLILPVPTMLAILICWQNQCSNPRKTEYGQ